MLLFVSVDFHPLLYFLLCHLFPFVIKLSVNSLLHILFLYGTFVGYGTGVQIVKKKEWSCMSGLQTY